MTKLNLSREHLLLGLCAVLAIAVGLIIYTSTGRDDAHITFWPAYTLAERGEILNYSGERLEQSSTLSFVLWLALIYKLTGWNLADIAYLSGMLFLALTIIATYYFAKKVDERLALPAAISGGLSPWLLYWSFSKMEVPMVAFLLVYGLLLITNYLEQGHTHRWQWARLVIITWLLAAARPEMPLILGALCIGLVVALWLRYILCQPEEKAHCKPIFQRALIFSAQMLIVIASLFAFRYLYFGQFFPQPVYAKVSSENLLERINHGFGYISYNMLSTGSETLLIFHFFTIVGWCAALLHLIKQRLNSIPTTLTAGMIILYGGYIIMVGGDWMENGRFIAHIQPLLLLFTGTILLWFKRPIIYWLGTGFLVGLIIFINIHVIGVRHSTGTTLTGALAYYQSWAQPYAASFSWSERSNRINARDIPVVHHMNTLINQLIEQGNDEIYILSGQQGMISYYIAYTYSDTVALTLYDKRSLADNSLVNCSLFNWTSNNIGSIIEYSDIEENLSSMKEVCGLEPPDIIFDFKLTSIPISGYKLYYQQIGWTPREIGSLFPLPSSMNGLELDQSIYVREGLLPPDFEPIIITADDLWQTP